MRQWLRKTTCEVCGKTEWKHNKTKTCSYACRDILRKRRREAKAKNGACPGCSRMALLSFKAGDFQVCSKKCTYRVIQQVWRAQHGSSAPRYAVHPRPLEVTCANCKKVFIPDRYNARFCSTTCRDRHFHKTHGAQKSQRRREAVEAHNKEIGQCALCEVRYDQIRLSTALGSRSNRGKFHKDHITPRSKNGSSTSENQRYLCWFCNLARTDIDAKWDAAIAAAGRAFWRNVKAIR